MVMLPMTWLTPKHVKPPQFLHISFPYASSSLLNWSQRLQIWCTGWMCKSQPTDDKLSVIGAWSDYVTHYNILGLQSYHWNGWPKMVKLCTRVGNINSMQQDDISPTKGRGYSHVTVLKLCR